jgi:hypothetical protein
MLLQAWAPVSGGFLCEPLPLLLTDYAITHRLKLEQRLGW